MNPDDTPRHYTTAEAARVLGIHPKTFERLRKKHGIEPSGERRTGKVRVYLYSDAVVDYCRSLRHDAPHEQTAHDTTEQPSKVLSLVPRAGEALAIRLYEDNQSLAIENAQLRMELDAALVELAAFRARHDRPRRRWWQWRQKEDGG